MLRNSKGFTLIELMIVVAIIGILAAIAIPNFVTYQCKSKQVEAKTNLAAIGTCEASYFAEFDKYNTNTSAIGFNPSGTIRYAYTVAASGTQFTATASGSLNSRTDMWTYNQGRTLANTTNACT
ncbi:MAG: prepilin-type N-terminal cleavage/methylation domain-containing protein [Desulfobacterales bacterium]|nr:prepilin-type N-terminal cleavage/methylation domain-containing protein [Desulfobacterales bacterium]